MSKVRDLPQITQLEDNDLLYAVDYSEGANGGRKITKQDLKESVKQSPEEIKTAYESNDDTNAFTDAEKTKLAGIENGATADQNASEVPYNNSTSGLTAIELQSAVDEVNAKAQADFRPSIVSGRILNYTGGTARFDGVFYELVANDILLTQNITNGEVYLDLDGVVKQTGSGVLAPPYTIVFAKFSTDLNNITSLTDERVKNSQNIIRGILSDVRDVRAGAAASEGSSGRVSDAMHKHNILTGAPSVQNADQSNAEGTSANLARADHVHNIPTAAPSTIGIANSQGVATSFAKSDHIHNHGSQPGGDLHAEATPSVAGFMSSEDKTTIDKLNEIWQITKEPTGFENRTDSEFSFDDGTRTFTIQPTGVSFDYWVGGVKYTITSPQNIQISDIDGVHLIYFDGATLTDDLFPPDVSLSIDIAFVAALYWDQTNQRAIYLGEERHGMAMDGATHSYLHDTQGTRYISGLSLEEFSVDGDGSSNSQTTFAVDDGAITDEDIRISITDNTPQTLTPIAEIPIYYRLGSGITIRKKDEDSYPLIYSGTAGYTGASGRAAFNEFDGVNWVLTEVSEAYYFIVHVLATNDVNTPIVAMLGQQEYATMEEAATAGNGELDLGGLPFQEFVPIAAVIYKTSSGYTNATKSIVVSTPQGEYIDFRDIKVFNPGAASVHGSLSGLANDDHPQYLNRSGVRPMTGDLNMGANDIINVGLVDGVDVSSHASRHLPSGADPIATASAVGLDANSINSSGSAESLSRSDHTHDLATGVVSTQTPDQSNAEGTSANLARADHIHNIPAAAPTTTLSPATTNAEGVGTSFARNDHTHAIATGLVGELVSIQPDDAAAAGTIDKFARIDHKHAISTDAPTTTLSPTTTNAEGVGSSFARNDHTHAVATGLVGEISSIEPDDAASAGVIDKFARIDHQHAILAAAPSTQNPDQANAEGVSTSFARADHIHNIPADAPTTTLSPVTSNAEGVGTSFARNDHTHAIATGLVGELVAIQPDDTAAAGTVDKFARVDHRHAIAAAAPTTTLSPATSNAEGSGTSFARNDHTHAVATALVANITTIQPDDAAAAGTSDTFARGDHKHAIVTAAPSNTGTANSEGSSTSFARADHIHNTTIANSVASATADDTTTSATDVLIVGMTLTPAAGTYLATFSSSVLNSANGTSRLFVSIYSAGTQVAHSEREIGIAGGANVPVHSNAVVTVNGAQAIEARWRAVAGTNTAHERSLTLIRLGD